MVIEELLYGDFVPYVVAFLVGFAVLFYIMNRGFFKDNRGVSVVISLGLSALMVWSLQNYTDYFGTFVDLLGDLEGNMRMIFFGAGAVVILLLLWAGLKKGAGKREFPAGLFGLSALFIFGYFLGDIISIYYLPEWLQGGIIRGLSLIIGVAFGIWGLWSWSKKKYPKFKVKVSGMKKGILERLFG